MPKKEEMCRMILGKDYEPGVCPFCDRRFDPLQEFSDEVSIREYYVSGLCQRCQDDVFGGEKQAPPLPDHLEVVLTRTLH